MQHPWYYWTAAYDGSVIKHLINAEQVGSTHTVTGNIEDNENPMDVALSSIFPVTV
jgi:hypothetical protein